MSGPSSGDLSIDLAAGAAGECIPPAESVRGKHVLVVGINYWPEPTGIAPYTTLMAEHLARSAASVTVLAGTPCYPAWKVADGYGGFRSREHINGVDVIRLAHHVPREQTALHRAGYEGTFMLQALLTRLPHSPDLVLAVTPAIGGAVAAVRISRRHNARLLIVIQDLMGKAAVQSGIPGGGSVSAVTARLEGWVLRQADRVTVVAEAFRPVAEAYGVAPERIGLLPNWSHVPPARTSRDEVRARMGWIDDINIALYTGNMGLKQDLSNVVEAARLSRSNRSLRWVLMGDGSQREHLEVQGAGLSNLTFLPPCDVSQYSDMLAAADVLLLTERSSVEDMSLPSKLTSYFVSGRPVAAAVGRNGATWVELARSGAAVASAAGEPKQLVDVVESIVSQPSLAAALGRAGRAYARSTLTPDSAMLRLEQELLLSLSAGS